MLSWEILFVIGSVEGSNHPFDITQSEDGMGTSYWIFRLNDMPQLEYLCGPIKWVSLGFIMGCGSRRFAIREVIFRVGM
jgi:hypothetical protein